jgi:mutator protein MutT
MSDPVPHLSRPGVTVAAAVIEKDGKVLIGQRKAEQWHPHKWEFPGGKVEASETPREALARELWEELGIKATIDEEITRYEYQYPGRPPIHLIFYRVSDYEGDPIGRVFERILWEDPRRFPEYDFLDGDIDFIRRMAKGAI